MTLGPGPEFFVVAGEGVLPAVAVGADAAGRRPGRRRPAGLIRRRTRSARRRTAAPGDLRSAPPHSRPLRRAAGDRRRPAARRRTSSSRLGDGHGTELDGLPAALLVEVVVVALERPPGHVEARRQGVELVEVGVAHEVAPAPAAPWPPALVDETGHGGHDGGRGGGTARPVGGRCRAQPRRHHRRRLPPRALPRAPAPLPRPRPRPARPAHPRRRAGGDRGARPGGRSPGRLVPRRRLRPQGGGRRQRGGQRRARRAGPG